MIILCTLYLSIPKIVFGITPSEQLAMQVFNKNEYKKLLLREDIRILLPKVLIAFRDSAVQEIMGTVYINRILNNPALLWNLDRNVDGRFIGLLSTDDKLREFFLDEQFFNVLKEDEAINKLIELIENAPTIPKTLEIVSENPQQGNPNTTLEPFVIEVKDLYGKHPRPADNDGNPVKVHIVFTIIKGNGTLSTNMVDANKTEKTLTVVVEGGKAECTLTLGPYEGIIQVEAQVKDTDTPELTQTFTAAAVLDDRPTVYITPNINGNIFEINDTFTNKFILNLNLVNVVNVTRLTATVKFDPEVIKYDDKELETDGTVHIDINNIDEAINVLPVGTFEVKTIASSTITLSEVILYDGNNKLPAPYVLNRYIIFNLTEIPIELIDIKPEDTIPEDVNIDGLVDISDLVEISRILNEMVGENRADVNNDGHINILDLVQVASKFGANVRECPVLLCVY